jgi:hypothetical protein
MAGNPRAITSGMAATGGVGPMRRQASLAVLWFVYFLSINRLSDGICNVNLCNFKGLRTASCCPASIFCLAHRLPGWHPDIIVRLHLEL